MHKYLLAALFASLASCAGATDFKIVTTKGYVGFSVPDDWQVISMQTKPPVSVAAFQVSNPADDGTPYSTNVAISLFHVAYDQGKRAEVTVGQPFGPATPTISAFDSWTVYTQEAFQGDVRHTVIDAKRPLADVVVAVRIAWPHLPRNPSSYDQQMQKAFYSVLRSVVGGLGTLQSKQGEVIRRPIQ